MNHHLHQVSTRFTRNGRGSSDVQSELRPPGGAKPDLSIVTFVFYKSRFSSSSSSHNRPPEGETETINYSNLMTQQLLVSVGQTDVVSALQVFLDFILRLPE